MAGWSANTRLPPWATLALDSSHAERGLPRLQVSPQPLLLQPAPHPQINFQHSLLLRAAGKGRHLGYKIAWQRIRKAARRCGRQAGVAALQKQAGGRSASALSCCSRRSFSPVA